MEQAVAAAQAAREKLVRTLGSYHGLLLCVQAYPFGSSPELFLALERDGAITPVSSAPIKCGTPLGAFASADSQIRGIAEAILRLDAEFAAMENEQAQIQLALTLPWDQAERYTQLRAELEALNAELSRQPDATVEASASEPAPLESGKLEIVEVCDADTAEVEGLPQLAAHMLLPPVALPEPSDPAAMAAALAHLAALDTELDEQVESEAAAEVEISEIAAEEDHHQPMFAAPPSAPEAVDTFSLEQQDVILPQRTSKATVAFGDLKHIKYIKATKQKPANNTPAATTAGVYSVEPLAPMQMSLF